MRTEPWAEATITYREQLTSSCSIITIHLNDVRVTLSAGQTINVSLQPPGNKRRISSFTVLSVRSDWEFNLLVRSTGANGVSDGLVSTVEIGGTVWISDSVITMELPTLTGSRPILCIVAGTGASILGGLAEAQILVNADIVFVGREDDCTTIPLALSKHLMGDRAKDLMRSWIVWDSTSRGRIETIDIKRLVRNKDNYATIVICGSYEFCEFVQDACLSMGISKAQIASESFGRTAISQDVSFCFPTVIAVVDLFGQVHVVEWLEGDSLLSAMLKAGLEAPYSCRSGICSTCQCSVLIGEAEMDLDLGLSSDEKAKGLSLACQLRPKSSALAVRFR